ncbi:hypothetical protein D3C81_2230830 [compost metagenome]
MSVVVEVGVQLAGAIDLAQENIRHCSFDFSQLFVQPVLVAAGFSQSFLHDLAVHNHGLRLLFRLYRNPQILGGQRLVLPL